MGVFAIWYGCRPTSMGVSTPTAEYNSPPMLRKRYKSTRYLFTVLVEDPCKHENWFVNGHFQSHLVVIRTTTRELKLVCSCSPFFSESIRTPGESVKLREMPHTGVRMEACRRKKALRRWEADFFQYHFPIAQHRLGTSAEFPSPQGCIFNQSCFVIHQSYC